MSGRYEPVVLRLEPNAIPAVRVAVDKSLAELNDLVARLGRNGYIEPWLGDPMSRMVAEYYNTRVMDAPDGPYAALRAYEAELGRIRDTLAQMEDGYRRTEGDNAALWGRA